MASPPVPFPDARKGRTQSIIGLGSGGVLIAARHGERLDYFLRDAGWNWVAEESKTESGRPWDPPLTPRGLDQARELGRRIRRAVREGGWPDVTAVYSSPLIRCVQTAAGAVGGLLEGEGSDEADGEVCGNVKEFREECEKNEEGSRVKFGRQRLRVRLEQGLAEHLNEKWYRSWSLPGSDGTWNYCPPGDERGGYTRWLVDTNTLHPKARGAVQNLLNSPEEAVHRVWEGHDKETIRGGVFDDVVDTTYVMSCCPVTTPYSWGKFESRRVQKERISRVASALAERHRGETVLLVAHGAPVTHLYEVVTGNHWSVHGVSGYASFSSYSHQRPAGIKAKDLENGAAGGREDADNGEQQIGLGGMIWNELVVNDCTHTVPRESAEYQSGK